MPAAALTVATGFAVTGLGMATAAIGLAVVLGGIALASGLAAYRARSDGAETSGSLTRRSLGGARDTRHRCQGEQRGAGCGGQTCLEGSHRYNLRPGSDRSARIRRDDTPGARTQSEGLQLLELARA